VALLNATTVCVLLGNGDGTFQPQQTFAGVFGSSFAAVTELNSDGRPDIASFGGLVELFQNDGPASIQFSAAGANAGESDVTSTIYLTRTGSAGGPVSVQVSVTGGTASQGPDFTFTAPQTVTWAHNDTATKAVNVPIVPDPLSERNETIQYAVALTAGASWGVLGSQTTTTTTIVDDDTVIVSVANASMPEGNGSGGTLSLPVTLTGAALAQTITVQYASAGGTAQDGTDFNSVSGTLTFGPGTTSQSINVPIVGDLAREPDETFTVTLANPTGATLGNAQAIGTIRNDDAALACTPRPRVATSVAPGGGVLQVNVESTPLGTATNNTLRQVTFGTFQNATVILNGQPVTSGQTVTVPQHTVGVSFTVQRIASDQPTTVPFTVVDGCGEWKTFVGGGANAGF
jgi:hypothetical protein